MEDAKKTGVQGKTELSDDVVSRRDALKRIAKKSLGAAGVIGGMLAANACYEEYSRYSNYTYYYTYYYYTYYYY